jgi:hypothetical protein
MGADSEKFDADQADMHAVISSPTTTNWGLQPFRANVYSIGSRRIKKDLTK